MHRKVQLDGSVCTMALVMIPCDLPWWSKVNVQLDRAALAKTAAELIDAMTNLHNMCK